MKIILSASIVLAFSCSIATAQTAKPVLPYPSNRVINRGEEGKIASNLPHIPLRLPVVQAVTQEPKTTTIHQTQNPAKVTKTAAKPVTKPAVKRPVVSAAATPDAAKPKPRPVATPAATAEVPAATSEAPAARTVAKKYSRRAVSAPPRQTANSTASVAAGTSNQVAEKDPAENWISDTYSVDENGNRIAPPKEQPKAVVEEAPAARPMQSRQTEVAPDFYGAHYRLDTETIQYGIIAKGSNGKRKFRFRNDGSEPLTITSIIPGCSCVTAETPKEPILPGKTGFIEVEYDTTHEGDFTKDFVISSNAVGEDAVKIVYIKGTVR